ncbi:MAG: hypothetical protein Q7T68_04380, partial [Sphingopyxis sp.]|nr:hypothetical protein [Sphingopyxis sp.]
RLVERADRLIKLSWLERLPCPVLLHLRTVRCEPQPEGTLIPAMHERRDDNIWPLADGQLSEENP